MRPHYIAFFLLVYAILTPRFTAPMDLISLQELDPLQFIDQLQEIDPLQELRPLQEPDQLQELDPLQELDQLLDELYQVTRTPQSLSLEHINPKQVIPKKKVPNKKRETSVAQRSEQANLPPHTQAENNNSSAPCLLPPLCWEIKPKNCKHCLQVFTNARHLRSHKKLCAVAAKSSLFFSFHQQNLPTTFRYDHFICSFCHRIFTRKNSLEIHVEKEHPSLK